MVGVAVLLAVLLYLYFFLCVAHKFLNDFLSTFKWAQGIQFTYIPFWRGKTAQWEVWWWDTDGIWEMKAIRNNGLFETWLRRKMEETVKMTGSLQHLFHFFTTICYAMCVGGKKVNPSKKVHIRYYSRITFHHILVDIPKKIFCLCVRYFRRFKRRAVIVKVNSCLCC